MENVKIPGYRIEKKIGKGGMSSVYLAVQESLDRKVALKFLKDPEMPDFCERFMNEAKFVASLVHKNIVTIYDIGRIDNYFFISMEHLEGGDLTEKIERGLDLDQALRIMEDAAEVLYFVHEKGYVHRDVKPPNIMFRKNGELVLTDFGIAKHIQQDSSLTVTGAILGSPYYLSPERAEDSKNVDAKADIYSLGVMFYEMLTGERPFKGKTFSGVILAHINNPIPRLPEELSRFQPLLDRMIAKDPEERIGSCREIIETLRSLKTQGDRIDGTPSLGEQARNESDGAERADGDKPMSTSRKGGVSKVAMAAAVVLVLGGVVAAGLLMGPSLFRKPSERVDAEKTKQTVAEPAGEQAAPEIAIDLEAKKIKRYLDQAQACLESYKLTTPEKDNARYYFNQILALDPEHDSARKGFSEIGTRYAWLAKKEMENQELDKARTHVDLGLSVDPGNEKLRELKDQLEKKEQPEEGFSLTKSLKKWFGDEKERDEKE